MAHTHESNATSSGAAVGSKPQGGAAPAPLKQGLRQMSYDEGAARLQPGAGGMYGPEAATVTSTTDPRLTYTQKAKGEQQGLDANALPYTDPAKPLAGWNYQEILSKLTQVDESDDTFSDEVRCGAQAALAIAIMGGPSTVTQASKRLDRKYFEVAYPQTGPKPSAEKKEALTKAYMDSGVACFRMSEGVGTYDDLSQIAHAMKVIMAADPRGATTGHESAAMAGLAGDTEKRGTPMQDIEHIATYAKQLAPGEAYLMNVDTDVYEGGTLSDKLVNHCIVLGKEPAAEGYKGRVFLYDPYPREGTQYMYSTDPGFWTIFQNKEGKPKAAFILSKTSAGQYSKKDS